LRGQLGKKDPVEVGQRASHFESRTDQFVDGIKAVLVQIAAGKAPESNS
jgi:hypothetical protein